MGTITYRQLLDYTVGVLYELRVKQKRTGLYSLKQIVNNFDYEASFDEIKDIAKYLEAQGFIKALFTYGDVLLDLTTRGIIYFEEKDKAFIASFEAFINELKVQGKIESSIQVDQNIVDVSKDVLIKDFSEFKNEVMQLNDKLQFNDYLFDIEILISELKKDLPDREILAHKANKLLENLKFRDKISNLISKLNIE